MENNLLIDTNVSTGFRDLLQAGKILLEWLESWHYYGDKFKLLCKLKQHHYIDMYSYIPMCHDFRATWLYLVMNKKKGLQKFKLDIKYWCLMFES